MNPETTSEQDYLDSIDISNEIRLLNAVNFFGSYRYFRAIQERTRDLLSKGLTKYVNSLAEDEDRFQFIVLYIIE